LSFFGLQGSRKTGGKKKEQQKKKSYSLKKKIPIASLWRRLLRFVGGDSCRRNSTSEEAPSLARKIAH